MKMNAISKYIILIIFVFHAFSGIGQNDNQPPAEKSIPLKGEGLSAFLRRNNLLTKEQIDLFMQLNSSRLGEKQMLKADMEYLIPSTIKEFYEPLFGTQYAKYTIDNERLKGACFYLVSGHGGPDPGAIGTYEGHQLCEDEYAYDIMLRLARNLLIQSAKVHIIIQDADDGIRMTRHLFQGMGQLDAPALSPAARMDLGFYHHRELPDFRCNLHNRRFSEIVFQIIFPGIDRFVSRVPQ